MKKLIVTITAVVVLISVSACGGNSGNTESTESSKDTVQTTVEAVDGVTEEATDETNSVEPSETTESVTNFTKSYEGAIDGKYGIIMTLTRNNNLLSGTYSYKSSGTPITISGNIEDNGTLTINEFNKVGGMTGIFKGQLTGVSITGNWQKPDGSKIMPFTISETENSETSNVTDQVICTDEYEEEEEGYRVFVKRCQYKNYKAVVKGYPVGFSGNYDYNYTMYAKQPDGSYIEIENSQFFNDKRDELLTKINNIIKKDFNNLSNDPDMSDCFSGVSLKAYSYDKMGIEFEDNKIMFIVTFGLSTSCRCCDGTIVSFTFDEIQKYLNE